MLEMGLNQEHSLRLEARRRVQQENQRGVFLLRRSPLRPLAGFSGAGRVTAKPRSAHD